MGYFDLTKKLKISLASLFLVAGLSLSGKAHTLEVHERDGSCTYYLLQDEPELSLTEGLLTISCGGDIAELRYADIEDIRITGEVSGVHGQAVTEDDSSMGIFVCPAQDKGAVVRIYSTQGRLVKTIEVTKSLQAVPLGDMPSGIYIVNIGNTTFKIKKQQ